ncbi:hypothetical protein B0H17DRAFT_1141641 [Mycena rosella]|uniref:Uncharacterized protein n=1 Tax=Mycena rosella TaxID=1033263 RepID=A0AAD7D2Y7_MYCRO|nr:hypothetical protein B0H17DRAFT_1141641 [Mycena rosella]
MYRTPNFWFKTKTWTQYTLESHLYPLWGHTTYQDLFEVQGGFPDRALWKCDLPRSSPSDFGPDSGCNCAFKFIVLHCQVTFFRTLRILRASAPKSVAFNFSSVQFRHIVAISTRRSPSTPLVIRIAPGIDLDVDRTPTVGAVGGSSFDLHQVLRESTPRLGAIAGTTWTPLSPREDELILLQHFLIRDADLRWPQRNFLAHQLTLCERRRSSAIQKLPERSTPVQKEPRRFFPIIRSFVPSLIAPGTRPCEIQHTSTNSKPLRFGSYLGTHAGRDQTRKTQDARAAQDSQAFWGLGCKRVSVAKFFTRPDICSKLIRSFDKLFNNARGQMQEPLSSVSSFSGRRTQASRFSKAFDLSNIFKRPRFGRRFLASYLALCPVLPTCVHGWRFTTHSLLSCADGTRSFSNALGSFTRTGVAATSSGLVDGIMGRSSGIWGVGVKQKDGNKSRKSRRRVE